MSLTPHLPGDPQRCDKTLPGRPAHVSFRAAHVLSQLRRAHAVSHPKSWDSVRAIGFHPRAVVGRPHGPFSVLSVLRFVPFRLIHRVSEDLSASLSSFEFSVFLLLGTNEMCLPVL